MKKSVVFLLVLLALVVLVSPGIVGRLAERTMDENLDRAASETAEFSVTSRGFERGWFSSAGTHRVEIRDGEARDLIVALVGPADPAGLPALIIETRLDHGLIPVSSMAREQGSLLPGLGSAVSTLALEFPGGETIAVPGTIYSRIGVTGTLESRYALPAGNFEADGGTLTWGDSEVVLTSHPTNGKLRLRGTLAPLAVDAPDMTLLLGAARFDLDQVPSRVGIPVGTFELELESAGTVRPGASTTIGPLEIRSSTSVAGDRVAASARLRIDNTPLPPLGTAAIGLELALDGADGPALAQVQRALHELLTAPDAAQAGTRLQTGLRRMLGQGLALRLERLDVALPAGTVSARGRAEVGATGSAAPGWPAILLATDAELALELPAEVVELITSLWPEANAMVALGYLHRQGEHYLVEAGLEDGTLTINGAPMALAPGAFR